MQRLDGDAAALAGPDRRGLSGLDPDILLVGQVREHVRQVVRPARTKGGAASCRATSTTSAGVEALALAECDLDDGLRRVGSGRRWRKRDGDPRRTRRRGPARRAGGASEGEDEPGETGTALTLMLRTKARRMRRVRDLAFSMDKGVCRDTKLRQDGRGGALVERLALAACPKLRHSLRVQILSRERPS